MVEGGRLESGYSVSNRNQGFESPSLLQSKKRLCTAQHGNQPNLVSSRMQRRYLACVVFIWAASTSAFFDNRFFVPFLYKDFLVPYRADRPLRVEFQPFIMTANSSYTECEDALPDRDIGVYQQYGCLNPAALDQSLRAVGKISQPLLRSDWLARDGRGVEMMLGGRLDAMGAASTIVYYLTCNAAVGARLAFYRARGFMRLSPDFAQCDAARNPLYTPQGPGDTRELFEDVAELAAADGLVPGCWTVFTLNDLDIFIRGYYSREYIARLRSLDIGLQGGILVPSAARRNIHNPASIPADGDGHWGFYGELYCGLMLKEDMTVGAYFRMQKRTSKTQLQRFPYDKEPLPFGVVVKNIGVHNGLTVGFMPFILFEGLRDGFGVRLSYAITGHAPDSWYIPTTICGVQSPFGIACRRMTSWVKEYVGVIAFYDWGRDACPRSVVPYFGISADIPVEWIGSRRAAKTYGISFILSLDF